ncbi:MAG: glucoamylase family protein, partial [Terriglobales bacterium]
MAGLGICLPGAPRRFAAFMSPTPEQRSRPAPPPVKTSLTGEDDQLLDEIEQTTLCYFWEQANPLTGLVKDRC